jgi:hypothetical protein
MSSTAIHRSLYSAVSFSPARIIAREVTLSLTRNFSEFHFHLDNVGSAPTNAEVETVLRETAQRLSATLEFRRFFDRSREFFISVNDCYLCCAYCLPTAPHQKERSRDEREITLTFHHSREKEKFIPVARIIADKFEMVALERFNNSERLTPRTQRDFLESFHHAKRFLKELLPVLHIFSRLAALANVPELELEHDRLQNKFISEIMASRSEGMPSLLSAIGRLCVDANLLHHKFRDQIDMGLRNERLIFTPPPLLASEAHSPDLFHCLRYAYVNTLPESLFPLNPSVSETERYIAQIDFVLGFLKYNLLSVEDKKVIKPKKCR